jgi:hypothetical protein
MFEVKDNPLLYWFGIPRNVRFPGVMMDIDRYASMVVAKDGGLCETKRDALIGL